MVAVLVLGFHRSGTSMVTRMLHRAGLFVGDKLLGAGPSNPYGHFEDEEVIAFHDRILRENGRSWTFDGRASDLTLAEDEFRWMRQFIGKRNSQHEAWGFKDPRACIFAHAWKEILDKVVFLCVFRDFIETSQSLLHRQSRDIVMNKGSRSEHVRFWRDGSLALRMWVSHNREVLRIVRENESACLCVRHRQVLDGFPVIEKLGLMGAPLQPIDMRNLVDMEATHTGVNFLPGLENDELLAEARSLWLEIERLTGGRDFDLDEKIGKVLALNKEVKFDGRLLLPEFVNNSNFREYQKLYKKSWKSFSASTEAQRLLEKERVEQAPPSRAASEAPRLFDLVKAEPSAGVFDDGWLSTNARLEFGDDAFDRVIRLAFLLPNRDGRPGKTLELATSAGDKRIMTLGRGESVEVEFTIARKRAAHVYVDVWVDQEETDIGMDQRVLGTVLLRAELGPIVTVASGKAPPTVAA